jgi:hypothetical protein
VPWRDLQFSGPFLEMFFDQGGICCFSPLAQH